MLYFTRWKAAAILLTALVVCLFAVPNFFPESIVQDLAELGAAPHRARPRPAGRLAPPARGRYQRGAQGAAAVASRRRAAACCAQAAFRFTGRAIRGNSVEVRITRDTDVENALSKLRELSQPLGGMLGSIGQRSLDITDAGGG